VLQLPAQLHSIPNDFFARIRRGDRVA
jgi:hypothetical protein